MSLWLSCLTSMEWCAGITQNLWVSLLNSQSIDHLDSQKSALVGVFPLGKLANATNQGFLRDPGTKHLPPL